MNYLAFCLLLLPTLILFWWTISQTRLFVKPVDLDSLPKLLPAFICALILLFLSFFSIAMMSKREINLYNIVTYNARSLNDMTIPYKIRQLGYEKYVDYVTTKTWSHSLASGCDFMCRVYRNGLYGYTVLENLCLGSDVTACYTAWRKSKTHNEVLNTETEAELLSVYDLEDGRKFIILTKYEKTKKGE